MHIDSYFFFILKINIRSIKQKQILYCIFILGFSNFISIDQ